MLPDRSSSSSSPAGLQEQGPPWFLLFTLFYGVFVGLPFVAPVLMHWGWEGPARVLYTIYGLLCHQMAQRSFFLFGPQWMYNLPEIQSQWLATNDPLLLRQFIGNETLGWKVAWSDRMVWMYSGVWVWAQLWRPLRRRVRPLPWWGLGLLLLPLGLDGVSHLLSDAISGIGLGFRYHNAWLAALTGYRFSTAFYTGDAVGSFNFWMRLFSGLTFSLGVVWFLFPRLDEETMA